MKNRTGFRNFRFSIVAGFSKLSELVCQFFNLVYFGETHMYRAATLQEIEVLKLLVT